MKVKSYEAILMEFPEYRAYKSLMLYIPPVLMVLGTFGNVSSFIILRRRAMVKVSSYHYLASLAVADSLVLYIGLFRLWLGEMTGTVFHNKGDWVCKLTITFGYMASDLSVWLIIAVTVERYIVVCFPLKASTMINTNRAKKVIVFLIVLMFAINLHFFWTVEIVDRTPDGENVTNCEAAANHTRLVNEVWPWVDACIYSFVPFIVILVLNILIIMEVVDARNHRRQMQNSVAAEHSYPHHHHHHHHHHSQTPSSSSASTTRLRDSTSSSSRASTSCRRTCGEGTKLTIMLLTVSFTFLLTTLPTNVTTIVTAFWQQYDHSWRQMAQFRLAKCVAELLMYVNHSINFFLYCATGQKFRQQIAYMLRCRKEASYGPWTSIQTDDSRVHATVTNGHSHHHGTAAAGGGANRRRLLLANLADDDDDSDVNGEALPLRTL